jgi:hypothetical protein
MRLNTTAAAMAITVNRRIQMISAIFPIIIGLDKRKNKTMTKIE